MEMKMGLNRNHHNDHDDKYSGSDAYYNEQEHDSVDDLIHRKRVRRMLEERIERKRLKEDLEDYEGELDGEFDWDNLDR